MNTRKIIFQGILLTFAILVFNACKKDEVPQDNMPKNTVQVNFAFHHRVGSSDLQFDTIVYENAFGNQYSVSTLKYIVSDITFNKSDGTSFKLDDEHYVDARDENTFLFIPRDKVTAGEYSSISFLLGLNEEKNKYGLFPDPPENNMEWPLPLGGGYHYMKLEGKHRVDTDTLNYQAHTGATMGNQNFVEVHLPITGLNVTGSEMTIGIKMDINHWWDNPNMLDLSDITSIMGNQDMQELLQANGGDVFSVEYVN